MTLPTSPRIAQFLDDLRSVDESRFILVQSLRALVLGVDAAITEEIKYGGILFSAERSFCGVFAYTQHVSLEFGAGAALPDAFRVLEGTGKLRRHIKLLTVQDLEAKHVREYVVLARRAAAGA